MAKQDPAADKQTKADDGKQTKGNGGTQTKGKGTKETGKKGKPGKKGKQAGGEGLSVVGHPRAAASVRRAKGLGGIGGFAIAGYLSSKAGIPPDQIGERALGAGVAGYLLAWGCSVSVWRHLVLAEVRALAESRNLSTRVDARQPAAPEAAAEPSPR